MIHETIPVGMLACNCSVVADEASGEAIVIDPGDEIDRVRKILEKHRLKVACIVATHAHIDHVGGIQKLQSATGAPVLMHEADLPLYQSMAAQAAWLGVEAPAVVPVQDFLREGGFIRAGALSLEILHTAGHSPGSVSLYLPGDEARVFSGDTLFQGSIGRTDLWGGDPEQIIHSIREKLLALPDSTLVFPGHGGPTTIGEEREQNPFLRGL